MVFLQRIKVRPNPDDLTEGEARFIHEYFDVYAGEVIVDKQTIRWNEIDEIEVAQAARVIGPAGWIVRHFVHGNERYHVGLYFGQQEAVVRNVTLTVARYIVQCVAFYAPLPVRYTGLADLSPLIEE
jgi:hypothetical protein